MAGESPKDYYIDRGPKWFQDALNNIVDFAFSSQPLAGTGLLRNDSKLGRLLSATGGSGGAAGTSTLTPWQISLAQNPAGSGVYYASVRPGSVNSLVPANIFNTFLIVPGTNYIKIKCDTDGKTPNLITLLCDTSPITATALVAENVAPSTFYDTIGIVQQVVGAGGAISNNIFQIRSTNLNAQPAIDFLASRAAPSVFDEPFVRWYRWSITA